MSADCILHPVLQSSKFLCSSCHKHREAKVIIMFISKEHKCTIALQRRTVHYCWPNKKWRVQVFHLCCFLFFRSAFRRAILKKKKKRLLNCLTLFKKDFKFYQRGAAYLFVSEGAFAFSSDVLTLSHHHEVLRPPLLLVAGAGVWVQFGSLLHKFLPVTPSRLEQSKTNHIKPIWFIGYLCMHY